MKQRRSIVHACHLYSFLCKPIAELRSVTCHTVLPAGCNPTQVNLALP